MRCGEWTETRIIRPSVRRRDGAGEGMAVGASRAVGFPLRAEPHRGSLDGSGEAARSFSPPRRATAARLHPRRLGPGLRPHGHAVQEGARLVFPRLRLLGALLRRAPRDGPCGRSSSGSRWEAGSIGCPRCAGPCASGGSPTSSSAPRAALPTRRTRPACARRTTNNASTTAGCS